MASLGHVAVGVAAGRAHQRGRDGSVARVMLAFSVVSLLPDIDALAFVFGIPYGAPFGHRGASHSLFTALLVGVIGFAAAKRDALRTGAFTAIVMATHGLLDAMTDGGRGIALLWPLTATRYFLPWRPIPVAPIGRHLFSHEGLSVMAFELVAFLPFWLFAFWPRRRA